MSEFTKEDRERIVRLEVGVATLTKSFDEYREVATSQVGFPKDREQREMVEPHSCGCNSNRHCRNNHRVDNPLRRSDAVLDRKPCTRASNEG
jgi:hypothetical protein